VGGGMVFGVALVAQNAFTSIATTEAGARDWVKAVTFHGGPSSGDVSDTRVEDAIKAFGKLPPSARASVTTQLYAWTKAYVSTPAFNAEYVKNREAQKPHPSVFPNTVDEELKAKVATEAASQEESAKAMERMGMKDQAAAARKQWLEMRDQLTVGWRREIEEQRQNDKDGYADGLKHWEEMYPPDVPTIVRKALREFLDTTTDVDFAAKKGPLMGGNEYGFLNEAYWKKPWQWKFAWEFGPDAIAAARTAAQAWLKELGGK
jgi:hypothetical protein